MINTGLGLALVCLTTLATVVMIGLGFLPRPSRASATWSFAFAFGMLSSYGWIAADALGSLPLRAACAGLMLGAGAFIWVGLRLRRGAARSYWTVALAFAVLTPLILGFTGESEFYAAIFRAAFAVAAIFSAFTLIELVKISDDSRDEAMPLALVSAAYIVFAVMSVIDGVTQFVNTGTLAAADGLSFVRNLNSLASLVYLMCALITLLLLTRHGPTASTAPAQSVFQSVAADRLKRAHATEDRWWSVLDIRLDDPLDIRDASSASAYENICMRFAADVRATLPADADIERRGDTGFVVLLGRPEAAVRQILSRLLERVAETDAYQPLSIRLSASIGWAGVEATGYDLDDLVAAAGESAADAQRAGGDRWERAIAPIL